MKVSELGEFELVELITRTINSFRNDTVESWQDLITGAGDDAAAWRGKNLIQIATTDALVENVHFTRDITGWADLGWKALAINLSDIAAMGGIPRYALVSIACPPETAVEDVLSFYRNMLELAKQQGIAIIGGDTDNTPHISVTLTAIGTIGESESLLTRSSARPGDSIAVTGFLGTAAAGYKMLSGKLEFDRETAELLKQAFLRPVPRVSEGRLLADMGIKTAIDISDGLIGDIKHICKASNAGARLKLEDIPIAPVVKANFGDESIHMAMTGGEDYELLFTGPVDTIDKIRKQTKCQISIIGEITRENPGEVLVLDHLGKVVNYKSGGWEHFAIRS